MDDSNKLISWFLENKSELNLNITSYTWGLNFSDKIYDYNSKITFKNKIFEGRGTSYSAKNALIKSFAECVERIVLTENNLKTSNGIAIHSDYVDACLNARNEAIERDSYLCHFLTKTPFLKMNESIEKYAEIIYFLSKKSIELAFYKLISPFELEIVVCICTGENSARPFGLTLGMGCSHDIRKSIEKSLFESVRNAFHFVNEDKTTQSLSIDEFKSKKNHSEIDHLYLGYNREYVRNVLSTFTEKNTVEKSSVNTFKDSGQFQKLIIPELFSDLSLNAIRYLDPNMQDLFFGHALENKVNYNRLKSFDLEFAFENMNRLPHFLG